ncbi:MAG: TonB-dependent receptor [Acidobacteriota bacterium]|nr:TonB-dependent receptor [Acidobacteriota bacterium]
MAHLSIRQRFLLALLLGCLATRPGLAQTSTATVEGTVTDATGAAIPGATVTVLNTATGISRQAKADDEGRYFVNSLIPGTYSVTGEASGFSKRVLTGLTLNVGADLKEDVVMTVGEASTTVEVVAQGQLVDTQASSNGQIIDNKAVVELPLVNRQFYSLALLSPAAYQPAQNSTLGFRGGINIAGASEISNQFSVNGTFDNDMGVAQPSFRPSVEVIQEFKLLTGVYSAEYGRMSGGQVAIITKSGTNTFHGSAYEFLRNQITDARPYFNPAGAAVPALRQNTFGGTLGGPILKGKTFFFFGYEGQRIGRAVTAKATVPTTSQLSGLFTTSSALYNPATGQKLTPVAGTTNTYDLTKVTDASGNVLWNSTASVAAQTIAKLGYPAVATAGANNYNFSETRIENMNEESLRIDHTISDKDSLNGSWNYFRDPAFEPSNALCGSFVLPNFGCFTDQHSTLANIVYDRVLTPNLINEVRVGFQRLVQPRTQQDNSTLSYAGLPGGPYFTQSGYANNGGLPNVSVSGYSTIGGATNLPQDRWDNHYQFVDMLTWNHKAHTIKAGVDILAANAVNIITSSGRGAFTVVDGSLPGTLGATTGKTGDSMADFLFGYAYTSSIGSTAPTVYLNYRSYHYFLMDDWKITPYLTLNLGTRYELDAPVYSPHYTVSKFDLAAQQFIAAGPSTFNHLYNYDWNNLAPRVGFALQPFKKDTTVIKGAGGVFYNAPLLYNQFLTMGTQYPFRYVPTFTAAAGSTTLPGSSVVVANSVTLANPFPGGKPPCTSPTQTGCLQVLSALTAESHYATPYITEWSLGVQQQVTKSMVAEVTYFGSKGTRLPLSINLNQINPANAATPTGLQSSRPFSNYSAINDQDTRANSEYHSLQTSLKQSYSKGVSFLLAYTYGKSIDDGGGIGSGSNSSGAPQNIYNLRAERARSDFDVKHRIVFSPVAELPFGRGKAYLNQGWASKLAGGFQVSSIFTFQTGRPFTVSDASSNNSGSFQGADRPNVVGNPNAAVDSSTGAKTHTVAEWFNTHAFALATTSVVPKGTTPGVQGQFGNAGRNIVVGPKYVDLDLTVARNFPIHESLSGQFRAEGFDVFNHPNFFNPLTQGVQYSATSSSFGQITQANDNREFQFSLRLLF